jgi:hypothetical protein
MVEYIVARTAGFNKYRHGTFETLEAACSQFATIIDMDEEETDPGHWVLFASLAKNVMPDVWTITRINLA